MKRTRTKWPSGQREHWVLKSIPLSEASQMLCRESLELCTTAKAMCLESKEACLESKHAREASAAQRKTYAPLNGTLSRMKLKLFLDKDSYECLLNHLPHQAPSRAAINAAVLLGNTRIVDCDDVEARDLLSSAQGYCLGAVRGIAQAMRSAGLTP